MKKISSERFEWLKEKHYELWDWLAKNPDKGKNDWAGFKHLGHKCWIAYQTLWYRYR